MRRPRTILLRAGLAAALTAGAIPMGAPSTAIACSPPPPGSIEPLFRSDIVALADVISAGGPQNTAPTLTPTPVAVSTRDDVVTQTPTVDPLITPSPTSDTMFTPPSATATPTASLTPFPTAIPNPQFDLTGRGARLRIVEDYSGSALEEVTVDLQWRANYERELREYEDPTGPRSSCQPFGPPRYTEGARYLVFVTHRPAAPEDVRTVLRYRVVDGQVVLNDPAFPSWEWGYLQISAAEYHRYFEGIRYRDVDGGTEPLVLITAPRVPLARMLALVEGARSNTTILPPTTGNAGLAASRWTAMR